MPLHLVLGSARNNVCEPIDRGSSLTRSSEQPLRVRRTGLFRFFNAERSKASLPRNAGALCRFTCWTTRLTPLPAYRRTSASCSSRASCEPLEAPDGTAARPNAPESGAISTSTVGFPRESRISRAFIDLMADFIAGSWMPRPSAMSVQRSGNNSHFEPTASREDARSRRIKRCAARKKGTAASWQTTEKAISAGMATS